MAYYAGLDIGSTAAKAAIMSDGKLLAYHIVPPEGNYRAAAEGAMEEALKKAGVSFDQLDIIGSTGYGAKVIPYPSRDCTEVSAQARGVHHLFPLVRTVIDVGGQASRALKVNEKGKILDFAISEKCAAGSGRFLQVIAHVLQLPLEDIGKLSLLSKEPVTFTTSCAVFSESEAISRVAEGALKEDILAGVHEAMSSKILNLLERVGVVKDCVITGGGAKDIGLVKVLSDKVGIEFLVPEDPQITAALGAALIALEEPEPTLVPVADFLKNLELDDDDDY